MRLIALAPVIGLLVFAACSSRNCRSTCCAKNDGSLGVAASLYLPGFTQRPEFTDNDEVGESPRLLEIIDVWGDPSRFMHK